MFRVKLFSSGQSTSRSCGDSIGYENINSCSLKLNQNKSHFYGHSMYNLDDMIDIAVESNDEQLLAELSEYSMCYD